MNVLIVEDEPHAASRMKELVLKYVPQGVVVGALDSVKSVVAWFGANNPPDLILMDVQLADGISFEIFEKVDITSPVIFTTAYDEYALKAFKVNSIDYLLKPIDADDFESAIKKYMSLNKSHSSQLVLDRIGAAMNMLTKKYKERFVTKVGERLKFIDVKDVLFFYSEEKTTFCRTSDNRNHIIDYTLDQVEELIDSARYFRINRKYIVSVDSIVDMISHVNSRIRLVLKGSSDSDIIVARERVQEFRSWLDA